MGSRTKLVLLALLLAACLFSGGCRTQQQGFTVGCGKNVAGMVMNYAIAQAKDQALSVSATEGLSSYLLTDCCSSKSTWSLTSGDLDAAVLCPDAAAAFLAETEGFLLAGPLTYHSEAVVTGGQALPPQRIGYMSGQERQHRAGLAHYDENAEYLPVLASSLAYALAIGEVDAAVLDVGTAITLDFEYSMLRDETPTAVLVVSEAFYRSEQYYALLLALENASAAIREYEPFCEAMRFLFSEEMGRKEYEKWLSAEIKFLDLAEMMPPQQAPKD